MATTMQYVEAERTRNGYCPVEQLMRVVQNRGRRLATMGRPTSRGHVLSLEEAVFLMELSVAVVMVDSMPMSIDQGYRLLEHSRISWARYLAFGHLKRLGFIVIPTGLPMETIRPSSSSSSSPPSKRVRLRESAPSSLLQHIPHLDGNGLLSMVPLHRNRRLVPCEISPDIHYTPETVTSRSRRRTSEEGELRPRHWPRPMDEDRLLSASWKEFAQNRRILLKAADHRRNEGLVRIDYNIYRSDSGYRHSAPPEPVHRLSVIDIRMEKMPDMSAMIGVENLLLAVVDCGLVTFIAPDGRPMALD